MEVGGLSPGGVVWEWGEDDGESGGSEEDLGGDVEEKYWRWGEEEEVLRPVCSYLQAMVGGCYITLLCCADLLLHWHARRGGGGRRGRGGGRRGRGGGQRVNSFLCTITLSSSINNLGHFGFIIYTIASFQSF